MQVESYSGQETAGGESGRRKRAEKRGREGGQRSGPRCGRRQRTEKRPGWPAGRRHPHRIYRYLGSYRSAQVSLLACRSAPFISASAKLAAARFWRDRSSPLCSLLLSCARPGRSGRLCGTAGRESKLRGTAGREPRLPFALLRPAGKQRELAFDGRKRMEAGVCSPAPGRERAGGLSGTARGSGASLRGMARDGGEATVRLRGAAEAEGRNARTAGREGETARDSRKRTIRLRGTAQRTRPFAHQQCGAHWFWAGFWGGFQAGFGVGLWGRLEDHRAAEGAGAPIVAPGLNPGCAASSPAS